MKDPEADSDSLEWIPMNLRDRIIPDILFNMREICQSYDFITRTDLTPNSFAVFPSRIEKTANNSDFRVFQG